MERGERQQHDPYEVLGVPRDATRAQIRAAYRKLALRHHPDRIRGGDGEAKARANAKFAEISAAYEVLARGADEGSASDGGPSRDRKANRAGRADRRPSDGGYYYYDPLDAFGIFLGRGRRDFRAADPFGDFFAFTDPFELFRDEFRFQDFAIAPPDARHDRSGKRERGRGNSVLADSDLFFPAAYLGSHSHGRPASMDGDTHQFASYSVRSSRGSASGINGVMKSVYTSTRVINGKAVTTTETVIVQPDGSRETTIDVTGDEELMGRRQYRQPLDNQNGNSGSMAGAGHGVGILEGGENDRTARTEERAKGDSNQPNVKSWKSKFRGIARCLACCIPFHS